MPIPPYTAAQYLRAVGYKLRQLRKASGVSQLEAAAAVEMDRAHLANWEAGRHEPGIYRLTRLLGYYGCDPGECYAKIDKRARMYQRHAARRG